MKTDLFERKKRKQNLFFLKNANDEREDVLKEMENHSNYFYKCIFIIIQDFIKRNKADTLFYPSEIK